MYKVLIIDDEEPLREAIRILGDWKGLGIEKVLEATNGRSGLELLASHKIDIVMVDMKMPELGGVEFLQVVEREYPDLLTIVISGYNDFEFTRQAIHSRVVDYLLKPVNRHDLNQALSKAVGVLEAKRQTESEFISRNITLNMSLPKLKEKVYQSILDRSFNRKTNEAFLPLIGADNPNHRFGIAVFRMLNMDAVTKERFHQDQQLLHFAVANMIDGMSEEGIRGFSFADPKQEREIVTVFTLKQTSSFDTAFKLELLIKKAAVSLRDLFGIVSVAGTAPVCRELPEIAEAYEAARAAMLSVNFLTLKGGAVSTKPEQPAGQEPPPSIVSRMPLIRSALESGNLNHARTVLAEFLRMLGGQEVFRLGDADWLLQEYLFLLHDVAKALGVSGDRLQRSGRGDWREEGFSMDTADFTQYERLMLALLELYAERVRESTAAQRPFDAGDIKEYIDKHYFEDFKIAMFTEKYYLSREYLMKRFKQQFGFGIHEYVQKVRMDKAQQLLGDPALKIQDISEMLGYKDKNYFSKAYRNYYGMSPSEYRANLN
ncbi:DNA-binding response regulator [Paenibacillus sp. CAA11]|uniref:helix-turn-helix domain-containing protein n=1 Tax=Paenibacillus sp. CAA11 TaxID=1532905 RepID=UPI000D357D32|nr:helix-turn-helix domain-containing protein [Paenibacillus sp. CAA11]AWB46443.1 DNA-binding response regulator [Paenibacillus sp. CAA11]